MLLKSHDSFAEPSVVVRQCPDEGNLISFLSNVMERGGGRESGMVRSGTCSSPGEGRGEVRRGLSTNDALNQRQKVLAALSSAGKLIVATNSYHAIHLHEPDIVADAISDIEAGRSGDTRWQSA